MAHPNQKVAQASHTLFSAFVSSDKDSSDSERASLKEQLTFYYIERSLEVFSSSSLPYMPISFLCQISGANFVVFELQGFPGVTPFDGLASGVAALVRHLPAGSPAILYSIHGLADKTSNLCLNTDSKESVIWKNSQSESEPSKKLLELLLRLLSLVDIQVSDI